MDGMTHAWTNTTHASSTPPAPSPKKPGKRAKRQRTLDDGAVVPVRRPARGISPLVALAHAPSTVPYGLLTGDEVRALRRACRMKQRELGAEIGFERRTISDWETERLDVPLALYPQLYAVATSLSSRKQFALAVIDAHTMAIERIL
jgi:DNA-binding XRE family transcriptional regulator